MKKVFVYGPGCTKCNELADLTKHIIAEQGLAGQVQKVTDPMQFAVAGVLMTPSLGIDGKILVSGKVPSADELKLILNEALAPAEDAVVASCCCSSEAKPAASSCACDSSSKTACPCWKKAILWIAVILIALAAIKMVNKNGKVNEAPASAMPVSAQSALEVVYYQFGPKCVNCTNMNNWTKAAIEENFADAVKAGKVRFSVIESDKATVEKYALTVKSIIVKEWKSGEEVRWHKLEQTWPLRTDEAAYKQYIIESVKKELESLK